MPAIFTHIQFGKEVAALLPPPLREITNAHQAAFFLGTQGPDVLFYHKILKGKPKNPVRKKGWDLHAIPPEDFFLRGARLLLADTNNFREGAFFPNTPEGAYLLGFLCHFTLDSACHPYIDEHSVDGVTHGKIESEFDKLQFRKIGRPERGFNAATLFFPLDESAKAASRVLDVEEKSARRAVRSMRKINRLFSHKLGAVHGFCHAALTLVGMNKSFGEMFLHKKEDLRCKTLCLTLEETFQRALPVAVRQIVDFVDGAQEYAAKNSFQQDFYRRDYSGNLHDKEE